MIGRPRLILARMARRSRRGERRLHRLRCDRSHPPTELGITLAFAVLLDATIIRVILVSSLLGRLGQRAWWLPGWLARRLPTVRFSH